MHTTDRITVVLRPAEGQTLEQVHQFAGTGLLVAIGRGLGVLEGHCAGDAIEQASTAIRDLGRERELRSAELELWQAALAVDPLLTACAPEMFSLLERIELKCGGLNAVLGQGMEPSEMMWEDFRQALDDVWPMLCKAQGKEYVPEIETTDIPVVSDSMHIDERVKMVGAEPAFLTVVFKLPSLNDAKPLIDLLPYGQKALGTEAEVYGFSTGNLMEAEPCEQ